MNYRVLGATGYLALGVLLADTGLVLAFGPSPTATTTTTILANGTSTTTLSGAGSPVLMVPFQIATLISLALVSLTWLTAGMQKSSGVLRATAIVGVVLLAALGSYFAWTDFSMPTFTGPGSFLPRY